MSSTAFGAIVALKAFVVFGAFLTILYFAVLLARAQIPGSRLLLAGGTAVLVGYVASASVYYVGHVVLWLSLALDAAGAVVAAYGFAKVARAVIRTQRGSRDAL